MSVTKTSAHTSGWNKNIGLDKLKKRSTPNSRDPTLLLAFLNANKNVRNANAAGEKNFLQECRRFSGCDMRLLIEGLSIIGKGNPPVGRRRRVIHLV